MTASAIPCTAHVRRNTTRDLKGPPIFHTSAGASAWQTGQREVVRLRRVSDGRRFMDGHRMKVEPIEHPAKARAALPKRTPIPTSKLSPSRLSNAFSEYLRQLHQAPRARHTGTH